MKTTNMKEYLSLPATILVVDDEPATLEVIVEELKPHFAQVVCCGGAEEALDLISKKIVDCLVTDYRMPDMDGLTMVKEVRKLRPRLPIIMMTGSGRTPEIIRSIEDGVFDFIEKPFRSEVLINRVQNSLVLPLMQNLLWSLLQNELPESQEKAFFEMPLPEQIKVLHAYYGLIRTRLLKNKVGA